MSSFTSKRPAQDIGWPVQGVFRKSLAGKLGRTSNAVRESKGSLQLISLTSFWFSKPFDLSTQTKEGRRNRMAVGLPKDLNGIGWSISMPRIERDLFVCLLDSALEGGTLNDQKSGYTEVSSFRIDDSWSLVRKRHRLKEFRITVLKRHNYTCLVCGTRMQLVIEAAHVRSYATAPEDRANPANGICLCSFCHAAFDSGELLIFSNGTLRYASDLSDEIGLTHFTSVPPDKRRNWLCGVDARFLEQRAGINE